jgi:hypothetical protein
MKTWPLWATSWMHGNPVHSTVLGIALFFGVGVARADVTIRDPGTYVVDTAGVIDPTTEAVKTGSDSCSATPNCGSWDSAGKTTGR